ncbi:cytochrome P450 [Streptomyces sp. NPDC017979]|uniref:cytochrome P450 n=1 Tax=Streptomyces sp. NPDC017979 TaxID=3365024 RepID=UPI0037BA0E3C
MKRSGRCPFDPSPALTSYRHEEPVKRVKIWSGESVWVVTRYDDVRTVLSSPHASSDADLPGYPATSAAGRARRREDKPFVVMDDPQHARQRRMVSPEFMVKKMQALRPRVQEIVDGLIDEMLAGPKPVDLVQVFGLPVPLLVICDLLGVPYADRDEFQARGNVLTCRESTPEQMMGAVRDLLTYLADLVDRKDAAPEDDLLSRLTVEQVRTGAITREEAANMGLMLLLAGHETTANMIALSTTALLQNPEQLAELRTTEDQALIDNAVEEMLRYLTVAQIGLRRLALEDIEVGGQLIRKGEGIILSVDAANRDASAFAEPDVIDLHRKARHHLAFGYGIHQCLGQPLARVELQVVFRTLYRRIPTLRLAAPLEELNFKHDMTVYGVHELPVTW